MTVRNRAAQSSHEGPDRSSPAASSMHDTKVQLPERLSNRRFYNAVTGEIAQGSTLALRQVLRHFPVGILSTQPVILKRARSPMSA
jgi:maltooligosyltrehalose synthase